MAIYDVVKVSLEEERSKLRKIFESHTAFKQVVFTKVDDTCYIAFNSDTNPEFTPYKGLKLSGLKVYKIYLRNDASSTSGASLEIVLIEEGG